MIKTTSPLTWEISFATKVFRWYVDDHPLSKEKKPVVKKVEELKKKKKVARIKTEFPVIDEIARKKRQKRREQNKKRITSTAYVINDGFFGE